MTITTKLRNQYSKVMQPLYEVSFFVFLLGKFYDGIFIYLFIKRRAVRPNEDKVRENKKITAFEQLNRFLMSFIDHVSFFVFIFFGNFILFAYYSHSEKLIILLRKGIFLKIFLI
jgi:hypothetical protein